jgi:hypothetical protein
VNGEKESTQPINTNQETHERVHRSLSLIEGNENGFNVSNNSTVKIQTKLLQIQCLHQTNN